MPLHMQINFVYARFVALVKVDEMVAVIEPDRFSRQQYSLGFMPQVPGGAAHLKSPNEAALLS